MKPPTAKSNAPLKLNLTFMPFLLLALAALLGCTDNTRLSNQAELTKKSFLDWPSVLSVEVDPSFLYDPEKGILANFSKKGRQWEVPSRLSFYKDGQLLLGTRAGLRVHGGTSRRSQRKSFRLYFRDSYQSELFPFRVLKTDSEKKLNRLVVHNDRRRQWHGLNPLGYDIARQIGVFAPFTYPVRFYLNGEDGELYFLTERIDRSFLKRRFGHDKFDFLRYTGRDHIAGNLPPSYAALEQIVRDKTKPLSFEDASKLVDLLNLVRWTIAQAYIGNSDPFQGVAAFDKKTDGRWFWILWDMDHGFRGRGELPMERSYEKKSFEPLLNKSDIRSLLLTRLISESHDFRDFLADEFCLIFTERLTDQFLNERLEHYKNLLSSYGMQNQRFIEVIGNFMAMRPKVLKQHLIEILNGQVDLKCL